MDFEHKGIRISAKMKVLPPGTLSQTPNVSDFSAFLPWYVDLHKLITLNDIFVYNTLGLVVQQSVTRFFFCDS